MKSVKDEAAPERLEILPGTRYQLEYLLGDGGAGQVYRAIHLELDKPVAIKVLHSQSKGTEDYASRFRREAKAASAIGHPGVVDVTDFGTADDGRLFLVMELIEGQTLAEVIERGAFEPLRALKIALNLCGVLEAIHMAGVVHRDIKPANIFLLDDDAVKVVDFGIARGGLFNTDDWRITKTGRVVGTPGYMAPEHARDQEVDGRADLYSLGTVLYEMLTGIQPFRGDSPVDVLMAQMVKPPQAPSKAAHGHGIPRAADRVVRKLLLVDPDSRYHSSADVARDLRPIIEKLDASNFSVDTIVPRGGTNRWHLVVTGVTAVVLLLVGAAAGFWFLGSSFESGEATAALHTPSVDTIAKRGDSRGEGNQNEEVEREEEDRASNEIHPSPLSGPSDAGQEMDAYDGALVEKARDATNTSSRNGRYLASTPSGRRSGASKTSSGEGERIATVPSLTSEARRSTPSEEPSQGESAQELLRQARLAMIGRPSEAERLYQQAGAAGASQASVISGLGQLALQRGQHSRAVKLLKQAVDLRPGSSRLRVDLGRAYRGAGQRSRAIETWRGVLKREPSNAAAKRLLSQVGISD